MNDASDYSLAFAAKPQPLTLEQAAWITPPMQAVDTEGMIGVPRMRRYRQNRLREQIRAQGLDAIILICSQDRAMTSGRAIGLIRWMI